jgi:MFS family permease
MLHWVSTPLMFWLGGSPSANLITGARLTPPYRARTIGNLLLLAVCVIGLWAGSTYVPTAITTLAKHAGYSDDATVRLAGVSTMTVAAFTIVGCFIVPRLADRYGRRRTLATLFGLMIVGAVGTYGIAYPLQSISLTFVFLPILGVAGANFAVFTIWLPEQYPTRMRATAFAFTTTLSRWFAAAGTFLIGYGIHVIGSLTIPISLTAVVFALGIAMVRLAPETHTGKPCPTDRLARPSTAGLAILPGGRSRHTPSFWCCGPDPRHGTLTLQVIP